MKKYITLVILIMTFKCGYAQIKQADLNNGKHIAGSIKDIINGIWNCENCNASFQIDIKKARRKFEKGNVNVSFDCLVLTVTKYIYNGKDVKSQFQIPIELIVSHNDPTEYNGYYQDPITKNNIKLKFKQINLAKFNLSVRLPEMDITNDIKKGTVFPEIANFIR